MRHTGLRGIPSPDQEKALASFAQALASPHECFILKGSAGTGKTRMIEWLAAIATDAGRSVALLAPTGRAARVLGDRTGLAASTIHSRIYAFDRLELDSSIPSDREGEHRFAFARRDVVPGSDLLIVDEASMVGDRLHPEGTLRFGSGRLLTDLVAVARESILSSRHRGLCLVFVGDPAQLPPVGEALSPALDENYLAREHGLGCVKCELTEVLRQAAESAVLKQANTVRDSIRARRFTRLSIAASESGEVQESPISEVLETAVSAHQCGRSHAIVVYSNARALDLNLAARQRLWGDGEAPPRVGDLFLVNRNAILYGLYNGDLVHAVQVAPKPVTRSIMLRGEPGPVDLQFREAMIRQETASGECIDRTVLLLENLLHSRERELSPTEQRALFVDFVKRNGTLKPGSHEFALALRDDRYFNAVQVKYGYALTCHKAQGGEWESVSVDFDVSRGQRNEEFFRWTYTAITRTKRVLRVVNPPQFTEYSTIAASPEPEPQTPEHPADVPSDSDPDWNRWSFGPETGALFPIHQRIREALLAEGVEIERLVHEQYTERYTFSRGSRRVSAVYSYKKNFVAGGARVLSGAGTDPELSGVVLKLVQRAIERPVTAVAEVAPFVRDLQRQVKAFLETKGGAYDGMEVMPYRVRFTVAADGIRCKLDATHDKSGRWTSLEEVGSPGSSHGLREALACHLGSLP